MKIGVGLPAAVPGALDTATPEWAARAEELGFESVGVLDRLVYDNLDPLIALAAAAACTERVELLTTVLTVPVRQNAIVLAKQLASDLLLFPCSGDLSELERLAGAIPDTARMPSRLGNAGEQSSSK